MTGMRIVLTGRPGAGKSTQCLRVAPQLGVAHISIENLLREAAIADTPLGVEARDHLAAGCFIPDRLVIRLAESWLARGSVRERGFLLDGFPCTIGQATALFDLLAPAQPELVVELVVPAMEAIHRLLGRERDEDEVSALERRLHLYERQTAPMLRWMRRRVPVVRVDGRRPRNSVAADLLCQITARSAAAAERMSGLSRRGVTAAPGRRGTRGAG